MSCKLSACDDTDGSGKTVRRDASPDVAPPCDLESGAGNLGIEISLAQLEQFQRYYYELNKWNFRVNLTSVTGWKEVQISHYLDSLAVASVLPGEILSCGRFVDIGSGGGFPGVPLKIAFPGMKVTLIEANGKKSDFLRHLRCALELEELEILNGRAETLAHEPDLREGFDVVLARSISGMATLAELTLPFCRTGGTVVAHKSRDIEEELRSAANAIAVTGGAVKQVRPVPLKGLCHHSLVVMEKVSQTPDRYPRRPGMPAKRPL